MKSQFARQFVFELPCELVAVREVCRQARAGLAEAGLDENELGSWELLLAEAGNNAAEYAAGDQRNLPVSIEIFVTDDEVVARVFDHTAGFDFPERTWLAATNPISKE